MLSLVPGDKTLRRAAQLLMANLFVIVLLTFRQYGVTWDEELQSQYGQAVVDYYLSLGKDQHFAEIFNLYLYGGTFDGIASAIDRLAPFNVYETRHLLNALMGLLGLWGVWRLGRLVGGAAVGLLAMGFVTLTPMYYGHMFNNPKDIPFACGLIWSIYYMGRCFAFGARPKRELIIKLGLVLGLTLGVRVGGAMLFAFWAAAVGFDILRAWWQQRDFAGLRAALILAGRYILRLGLPVFLLAYVVMLICWPWAQQNPVLNPLRALHEFSNFPQDVEVLLDGTTYRSTELPWYYVPLYFGVQLPEFMLALILAGIVSLPLTLRRLSWPRQQTLIVIVLMPLVPILYAVLRHPALYDAVRHFLFAVPLLSIPAALAARYVFLTTVNAFHQHWSRRLVGGGLIVALGIAMLATLVTMIQLHPYEYIYVNRLNGGVAGAFGRYELDYWGSSFKEAAQKLQAYVAADGGVPPGHIYRVAICGPWAAATIYLPPDYEPVVANEPAEFFIATTRWQCQNMRPGIDIIHIKRDGALLSVVKDLRGGYESDPGNR